MCLASLLLAVACGPGKDTSDATGDTTSSAATTNATSTPTTGATADGTAEGTAEGTGDATTDAPPLVPECRQDSDCFIVNNCCQCTANSQTDVVKDCPGNCLVDTCTGDNLDGVVAACRSGVCEFANVPCSEGPVACDEAMPNCGPDRESTVIDGCWGPCMLPRYCEGAPCPPGGCGPGWTCIEHQATGSACVVVPFECAGVPTCECMAPYMDEFCPASCSEGADGLLCNDGG